MAAQGNSHGKVVLGTLLENGLGAPRDKAKAVRLYESATGKAVDTFAKSALLRLAGPPERRRDARLAVCRLRKAGLIAADDDGGGGGEGGGPA